MKYEMKSVDIGVTFLNVAVCGAGKPVILIHGLTNSWEGHIPLAQLLAKQYRVYIPDLPGYGDSGRLSSYSVGAMADSIHALIRKLRIKPVTVAGLSMGGSVVLEFGSKYPSDTMSVVIMGPVLKDKPKNVALMRRILTTFDKVPAGRTVLKRLVDTKMHGYAMAKFYTMYRFRKDIVDNFGTRGRKKMSKDAYLEMGISIADYDMHGALRDVVTPTLLLYGRQDKVSSYRYTRDTILSTNPHLFLSTVNEAGHNVCMEKPKETCDAIQSFVSSLLGKQMGKNYTV